MNGGVQMVARSDRGRVRSRNEDCAAVDEALGVGVLADGMGGLRDGHVASHEAVQAAMDYLRAALTGAPGATPEEAPAAAIRAANLRVWGYAQGRSTPMGTTAVVLYLEPQGTCRIAHVGDSRAYRLRRDRMEQLTRDHSLVQDLVERGELLPEQARKALNRNVITRAVGIDEALQPETTVVELGAGELVLLCSDGLWDMLEDADMARLLGSCGPGRGELAACAEALVAAANAAGGLDNVSVVLARRLPGPGG